MRISHKLAKLRSGEAIASFRRHIAFIKRHHYFPIQLTASAIIRTIDRKQFEAIRARHSVEQPGEHFPKYLDLRRWMQINLRRAYAIDLALATPRRVLDLGCGAGYFLYVCKYLGHEVLGLDLDEVDMYRELTELLRVPRVIARIDAFRPLPAFERPFDLITAHLICFNGHKSDALWGAREWEFFFNDAARHLTPRGEIHLSLNREDDGNFYPPELRAYFLQRGARLKGAEISLSRAQLAPAATAPAAS
ncbi:MAG: class I SAM-dependent methyltransferase [Verrucomicrobiota bacterium]|nr:class I SAM-dependent methyltransferase [Verrucomicrobiota bacterium]